MIIWSRSPSYAHWQLTGHWALIQFDSHTDLFDSYFGGHKFTHGTPFRRAVEEGLVDPKRFVQVGIRGTAYNLDDIEWGMDQGVRIIRIEELFERGVPERHGRSSRDCWDGYQPIAPMILILLTQPSHLEPAHLKLVGPTAFKPNR